MKVFPNLVNYAVLEYQTRVDEVVVVNSKIFYSVVDKQVVIQV